MRNFTLLLFAILWPALSHAYPIFSYGSLDYRVVSEKDKTAEVYSVSFYLDEIITIEPNVPDTDTGNVYTVIGIAENTFKDNQEFHSISLPSTLKYIGDYAFQDCHNLSSITFGGVEKIGKRAFYNCENILSLKLPESLKEIDSRAFANCKGLTSIIIPDQVTEIGEFAFSIGTDIEKVVLGKSVEKLNEQTFSYNPDSHSMGGLAYQIIFKEMYVLPYNPPKLAYFCFASDNGTFYVPEESLELYESPYKWGSVGHFKPMPEAFAVFYQKKYIVDEGDDINLEYYLHTTEDKEISMKWDAFNYRAVAVDNGVATGLKAGEMTTVTLTITDSDGNDYKTECLVEVRPKAGVSTVCPSDESQTTEVYSISGTKIGDSTESLPAGIYLIKKGGNTHKVIIR